jgi:pimeloyl-ACP methyl ester carboxylesterase
VTKHEPSAAFFPPTTTALQCDGLTFPVLTWGREAGRPILLLHGFPQEPSTWAPVAEALAEDGFRVFAPSQRGYTASTRPGGPTGYTFTQFAEDAIGIANALRLETFDVAGFGMGGAQAWMVTASQPARVRSLTSIRFPHPAAFAHGIQFEPAQKEKWRRLEQDLGAGGPAERATVMLANDAAGLRRFLTDIGLPQPFLDRYVNRLKEPGALAGALSWEHAVSPHEFSTVPPVTVPTLFLWSEGPALARNTVEATKNYVRASYQEHLIPNAGNFLLETSSCAVILPLRQHLQST